MIAIIIGAIGMMFSAYIYFTVPNATNVAIVTIRKADEIVEDKGIADNKVSVISVYKKLNETSQI